MPATYSMIMLMFLTVVITVTVVFAIGKIGIKKKWDTSTLVRRQIIWLFIVYVFTLFVITVIARGKRNDDLIGLIPFGDIYYIIKNKYPWYFENLIILDMVNIALFVPLGILAKEVMCVKKILPVITGTAVSLTIEVIQLITNKGVFDVNDIMYNTIGTLIGCGIYALCKKLWIIKQT